MVLIRAVDSWPILYFIKMGGKRKITPSSGENKRIYRKKVRLDLDEQIATHFTENELEKETELLNLIAEIIVNATLRELYETGN
ncbi:hypothetical protein [Mucilaginibacter rubeus]|uniref:hypothetical protein n=1 Tax=Mucilaginibacter rubeus TaxID=2027860 RepID=UPI001668E605|nr:hypothetical protein [Mucilaginibacter rubeus]GGA95335.1 hypothetical protein GCM10011500_08960 [Mucilaginibacter rubeus]